MANAIDATRNNHLPERKIDVELHECTNALGNTLYAYSITDNGRGMSEVSSAPCHVYVAFEVDAYPVHSNADRIVGGRQVRQVT
jgi:hypothetical protein|eukprot:COSAG01_NODE_12485_length_1731_cov_1.726716_2_plen_84_part_00